MMRSSSLSNQEQFCNFVTQAYFCAFALPISGLLVSYCEKSKIEVGDSCCVALGKQLMQCS